MEPKPRSRSGSSLHPRRRVLGRSPPQAVALQEGPDPLLQVLLRHHHREPAEVLLAEVLAQEPLRLLPVIRQGLQVPQEHLSQGHHPSSRRQGAGVLRQVVAVPGSAAQGQDGGTPVLGVVLLPLQADQGSPGPLEGQAAGQIPPGGQDLRPPDERQHSPQGGEAEEGPQGGREGP